MIGLIGKKVGMTQIFGEKGDVDARHRDRGRAVHRHRGADGGARRLRRGPARLRHQQGDRASRARCSGSSRSAICRRRATCGVPGRRTPRGYEVGQSLTVDAVREGRSTSTSQGVTKGRGFAGRGQAPRLRRPGTPRTARRAGKQPGSIGASAYPSRVIKGKRLPGRMGGENAHHQEPRGRGVDAEQNVLMVRGAVPGPDQRARPRPEAGRLTMNAKIYATRRQREGHGGPAGRAVRPAGARAPAVAVGEAPPRQPAPGHGQGQDPRRGLGRRQKPWQAEGHRARALGLEHVAAVAGRRSRLRSQAARLPHRPAEEAAPRGAGLGAVAQGGRERGRRARVAGVRRAQDARDGGGAEAARARRASARCWCSDQRDENVVQVVPQPARTCAPRWRTRSIPTSCSTASTLLAHRGTGSTRMKEVFVR